MMKVSVLITTYNLEKYIAKTLDTVLGQKTDFDYEIIVGDDGSVDGTRDIVGEYISRFGSKISMYVMPRDNIDAKQINLVERSSANRLNILKKAKGEYICFLDGDDFYTDSHRLSRMVAILDDPANSDCIMCAHNLAMYYGQDVVFDAPIEGARLSRARKSHKWSVNDYWPLEFIQANGMMFRNIYKDKLSYKASLEQMFENVDGLKANFDDNNITYSFLAQGKMYYIPDVMGAYRQVEGSSWNSNDDLKKAASNMIGASIEGLIDNYLAISNEQLSEARHYKDYAVIMTRKTELTKQACQPFYQTALSCNLAFALDVYGLNEADDQSMMDWKLFESLLKLSSHNYKKYKLKRAFCKLLKSY